MQKKPVIGLTLDYQTTESYSVYPWYALRENYCATVAKYGGIPLPIPYEPDLIKDFVGLINGLVVTGGQFDIAPNLYGETHQDETVRVNSLRTDFEMRLLEEALARDIPVLGICGGEQLLNVVLGGTLIQHIPDSIPQSLNHAQEFSRHLPCHDIEITAGSLLHQWFGQTNTLVNTNHHQAVNDLGRGVIVNARAPDGVIEGIEVPDRRFCVGVQWHPEFLVSPLDQIIFQKFIETACDAL